MPSELEVSALHRVAYNLHVQYRDSRSDVDLKSAIEAHRAALLEDIQNIALKQAAMIGLGVLYYSRYVTLNEAGDLDNSIRFTQESLQLFSDNDTIRPDMLFLLAELLIQRYLTRGHFDDLEEGILSVYKAFALAPQDPLFKARLLDFLSEQLERRFIEVSEMEDLDNAILITRDVANLSVATPNRAMLQTETLHRLAALLLTKSQYLGIRYGLDEAKSAIDEAISLNKVESDKILLFWTLSSVLYAYYEFTREQNYMREAIGVLREATSFNGSQEDKVIVFRALANLLHRRCSDFGTLKDLQESVQLSRTAMYMTPPDHFNFTAIRYGFASKLSSLAGTAAGSNEQLDEALRILEDLSDSPNKYWRTSILCCLASGLHRKFVNNFGKYESRYLSWIAKMLKYDVGGEVQRAFHHILGLNIIERGLEVAQEAVNHTPKGDVVRLSRSKLMLAFWLETRDTMMELFDIRISNTSTTVGEGLNIFREAISLLPRDASSIKQEALSLLFGGAVAFRYRVTQTTTEVLEEVILYYNQSLRMMTLSPGIRVSAGIHALELYAESQDWQKAYEAANITITLIARIVSQSLTTSDKQQRLVRIAGFASAAAAVALQAGKSAAVALEFLEQGRLALITSIEHLRTDILELEKIRPDLAQRLLHIQRELEDVGQPEDSFLASDPINASQYATQGRPDRHTLSDDLERLVEEIRQQDGFHRFLQPLNEAEMCAAAQDGPIVEINVSKYRCDAILVETRGIRSLPLPNLKANDVNDFARGRNLGSPRVLTWLWDTVAGPVVEALGYKHRPQADEPCPRLWWILTGDLSRFPLHAAGYHANGSSETVLDRVMSSYSLSIQSIVNSRRRPRSTFSQMRALLVASQATKNVSTLHYADQEVQKINDILTPIISECIVTNNHQNQIIEHLPHCGIFHFAGHGLTDKHDPLRSHLLLATEDRKADPFTVAQLLRLNLRKDSPFLAYLSACETGRVNKKDHIDESIHIVSAFQVAGFRHIIGTLWEVKDEICKEVAQLTYEGIRKQLKDGDVSDMGICRALHDAIRSRRDAWAGESPVVRGKRPEQNGSEAKRGQLQCHLNLEDTAIMRLDRDVVPVEDDKDSDEEALDWVPYVHFGV